MTKKKQKTTKKSKSTKQKIRVSSVDATPTPRDREIHKYLIMPIGRHRGLFSEWENVPWLADLIRNKQEALSKENGKHINLQPHEIRQLQREVKQYKENGVLYREIEDGFAVGFGFHMFMNYKQGENKKPSNTPLFDEIEEKELANTLADEIVQKIKSLSLYNKGQDIIDYLISSAHHQKKHDQIVIKQKQLVDLLDPHGKNRNTGQSIREILESLTWINYKIKNKEGKEIAFGNFIYDFQHDTKKKLFRISINPRFLGNTYHAITGNKEDRTPAQRKELFGTGEGYFYASVRKILLWNARKFSTSQRQLMDYLLLSHGKQVKLENIAYKLIPFPVQYLILDKDPSVKYTGSATQKIVRFAKDLKFALLEGTEGHAKIYPPIEEIEILKPSQVAKLVINCYIPANLETIWQEVLIQEAGIKTLNIAEKHTNALVDSDEITPSMILRTRKRLKMTQKSLGEMFNVSGAFIGQIEKGCKNIPEELRKQLFKWITENTQ